MKNSSPHQGQSASEILPESLNWLITESVYPKELLTLSNSWNGGCGQIMTNFQLFSKRIPSTMGRFYRQIQYFFSPWHTQKEIGPFFMGKNDRRGCNKVS